MREVRDRSEILAALVADEPFLQLYAIGDLDDFFFPSTRWFVPGGGGPPVALLYTGTALPVLLAITATRHEALAALVRETLAELPGRLYAHASPGIAEALAERYAIEPHGLHTKMALRDAVRGGPAAAALGPSDRGRLEEFYAASYPGNWFDPRMLETGVYRGIVEGGAIVAAGGVHVFSKERGVAALGNIAVHPSQRGRGLGAAVTKAVCRALADAGVERVGLNVKSDNRAAIACYERIGFERVGEYDELMLTERG